VEMNRKEMTEQNNQKWFHGNAFSSALHDPDFQEIAQRFLCGDVTEHGTLTDVQKALIRLVALTACQARKSLAQYTRSALDVGATPTEIKEVLYQCALDGVNQSFLEANVGRFVERQSTVSEET